MVQSSNEASMPSLFCAIGSETTVLTDEDIRSKVSEFLDALGSREDVLILPPDYTRFHSQGGKVTQFIAEHYNFIGSKGDTRESTPKKRQKSDVTQQGIGSSCAPEMKILPALGTHMPMTDDEKRSMFGKELAEMEPTPFIVHNWRTDVETIGHVPAEMVSTATNGLVTKPWPAQLNKAVWEKRHHDIQKQPHKSLVLSVGQVVPHEVMGMANFNKNIFVGTGGVDAINLSHFIGAVYGMEKMMGRASNPLRSILNYASQHFLQKELDLWYILTVMGTNRQTGEVEMRGLYIGNDDECYKQACVLSMKVNFTMLEKAPSKIVVYIDEDKIHSTWVGNKGIYRTRMAIADGGELIILAPGVRRFGEDDRVDELIRKFGYVGTPTIMRAMESSQELKDNLSVVAHLIHGSTEGRFRVTYCPGHLTREEIESVGFQYGDLDEMRKRYDAQSLCDGWNTEKNVDGENEEFFYVSKPALGLWAVSSRFQTKADQEVEKKRGSSVEISTAQTAQGESGGVGGWEKPPAP